MMNSGIIAINKPSGWTSFDVVNKIKHMVRPLKVGHLGTLDPMATGVLLVTVGKATRLFDLMQEKRKTYLATFKFGEETDTLDSTGEIVETTINIPKLEDIKELLPNFIGRIDQIPPKYSAKSINGHRAYDLARNNVEFELPSKKVDIHSISILDYNNQELTLEIECGSGTYIRSIGRDIARSLDSLAVMTSLVRTRIDNISVDRCVDISSVSKDNIHEHIISINEILDYPILDVTTEDSRRLLNGQILNIDKNDGLYKLNDNETVLALIKIVKNNAKMTIFLSD